MNVAVIMAGGTGQRFWPLSRKRRPKQLLDLTGGGSLLRQTVERLQPFFAPEQIYILTVAPLAGDIALEAPEIPPGNIWIEPALRDTAACLALAASRIQRLYPGAVMAVLPADHLILDGESFRRDLASACQLAAEKRGIITFGIRPTRPDTGYGYIKTGSGEQSGGVNYCQAELFAEKPSREKAEVYLAEGSYYWNSGMFFWQTDLFLELVAEFLPTHQAVLAKVFAAWGTAEFEQVLRQEYPTLPRISVDYGILEQAPLVYCLPACFDWDDLGSWSALARILPRDPQGNAPVGQFIGLDAQDCLVFGKNRPVAAIGVKDLIIVVTDDVVFVCPRERDQEVKKLLETLELANLSDLT